MDNKKEENNDNKKIKTAETKEDSKNNDEIENITREINLDDLYDGAVNNTVVIDPITNDEVLLSSKKPNFTLLGVFLAISILLMLYYINNKTSFGRTEKKVVPKTTTKNVTSKNESSLKGTLTCMYSSKSDAENQTVTYIANYNNQNISKSSFNYVVISNSENTTAVIDDLKNQYEAFYINNAAVKGQKNSFEKSSNGFTFNSETNHELADFNSIVVTEGQTILYEKPSKEDNLDDVKSKYEKKGFSCNLSEEK